MMKKHAPILSGFPYFLHGGDYNPDQWWHEMPDIVDSDMKFARLAGCNAFSIGIFAWSEWEPEEGKFDFSRLDALMDRLDAEHCKVLLATPSAAFPAWMGRKYPEIIKTAQDGHRMTEAGRQGFCWRSPVYREKVAIINARLAERYHGHPALGAWHLSNEYNGACYCPLCKAAFRDFLKQRYGTLETLNRAWWSRFWSHTFTAWEEIDPVLRCLDGMKVDWERFNTEQVCDFMKNEIAAVRRYSDAPATTNMMGTSMVLDYQRIGELCDFIANDHYPHWYRKAVSPETAAESAMIHDMHRAMQQKPWLLMESTPSVANWQPYSRLKRPGIHRAEELQAVAHGADGCMYFQFRKGRGGQEKTHGAIVDHANSAETRVFKEVAEVGDILKKIQAVRGTGTHVETAVVFDWESAWALNAAAFQAEDRRRYGETVLQHYHALWELNIPVDVIGSRMDYSRYRFIIAPMLYMLKPGEAEKIEKFIADGGIWVSTYLSSYVDESSRCRMNGFPGGGLRKVFGIWNEELDSLVPEDRQSIVPVSGNALHWSGTAAVTDFAERIHAEGAVVLGTYGQDFYAGEPALTCNAYGKGFAYYQAARGDNTFLQEFYRQLAERHGIARLLDTPSGVHVMIREGEEEQYLFCFNFQPEPQSFSLGNYAGEDMLTDRPCAGTMTLPAFGSTVIRLKLD